MSPIDLQPKDLDTVRAILQAHLPHAEVRAFGSRVRGTARKTSDLDLAILGEDPLGLARMAELRQAFSDSDLPFKVDLVEWSGIAENFRTIINDCFFVLQSGPAK
jgi:uncharacterized protein